jgi:hypothetical protein
MTKRQVSKVLRSARDLMNDKGTHWIKGSLRRKSRKKDVGYQFCMLGGIFEVLGESQRTYTLTEQSRPVVYALAHTILDRLPDDDEHAAAVVYSFNDRAQAWDQVEKMLIKAAADPVWEEKD